MSRKSHIARSVTKALIKPQDTRARKSRLKRIQRLARALITIYSIELHQHAAELFEQLRGQWNVDGQSYVDSFMPEHDERTALQAQGHMGFSGSTFFTTIDGKYLVKSVPRHFENSFFRDDLLKPYVDFMRNNKDSLLIRITDFLAPDDAYKISPGVLFGFAPSHHIIMENLLVGREQGEWNGRELWYRYHDLPSAQDGKEPWKWETWDLKPTTYFFPERDIAQGKLTSQATKSRLADEFEDKLYLTKEQYNAFMSQLNKDTALLAQSNAVDYSLFLVRIPVPPSEQKQLHDSEHATSDLEEIPENPFSDENELQESTTRGPDLASTAPTPAVPPFLPPEPPSWRTGVRSADGKYIYRAAILDFFWAKHKVHAKIMTGLVNLWNKIDLGGDKGPMSITTSSEEYRQRFTKMCREYIEVVEQ